MALADFVHLHTHSQYSLLDGACRIDQVVKLAKEHQMPAAAITDHGNMFGAIEFYKRATAEGIKPIIGVEAYVAGTSRLDKSPSTAHPDGGYHLLLLAENNDGYRNLIKLCSAAYLEGFYHRPRIDKELLKQHAGGLIATSACMNSEINSQLLSGRTDEAVNALREMVSLFGEGNFFLEIQHHGLDKDDMLIEKVLAVHKETGVPLVATNDCHYLQRHHAQAHDCLLCIQTGKLVSDTNRMKYTTEELYFKSPREMQERFHAYPEALSNTVAIAERCNVEIEMGKLLLPVFPIPESHNGPDAYLRHLCEEGLIARYGETTTELTDRLDYELGVIERMGYAGYFLIVRDFVAYARSENIPVGPGRGSAAGSLVSYVLGITNIDPMKFDLLFERFLNPERMSMPDIDIDFADSGRDKIIKYVIEKYGKDNVCQIITFGTMAARAVIRDVGRVLGMPYGEVDTIAKLVPATIGIRLEEAIEQVPELRQLAKDDQQVATLLEHSKTLEGLARHSSTHAAGVVIAPSKLTDYVPLSQVPGAEVTTQYDMKMVEEIGLLKMDFLGLKTLTVIDDCLRMIGQDFPNEKPIDIDRIPDDDPEVFALFARGDTIGVFQFESQGMRDYLRRLEPQRFTDLAVMNALYRPGPLDSGMIDEYIDRKKGKKQVTYLHPVLEEILAPTYGVIVFQEQVLKIANNLAGYSLGEADFLRKAMGKKIKSMMDEQREKFLTGADANHVDPETAKEIFEQIETFARYGFNKAHSVCYAWVAYQTAWLKAHYPSHFMAALLTSEMSDSKRVYVLLDECRRLGIKVLQPDVNSSQIDFSVEGENIRFGLQGVKNVGSGPASAIVSEQQDRSFTSLADLAARIEPRLLNKRTVEALVASGALDSLVDNRAQLTAGIEKALDFGHTVFSQQNSTDLFAAAGASLERVEPVLPEVPDWPTDERLNREKQMLGIYLTAHPLDRFREELPLFTTTNTASLGNLADGKEATVAGILTAVKTRVDKKGKTMAFATLEDYSGTTELLIFSKAYATGRDFVAVDRRVLVTGRVSTREGEDAKIVVSEVVGLESLMERYNCQLVVKVSANCPDDSIEQALLSLGEHPGPTPVLIAARENGTEVFIRSRKYAVALDFDLLTRLKELLGDAGAIVRPLSMAKSPAGQN